MKKIFSIKNLAIALVLLFTGVGMVCLIVLGSWKEYKNDEFGFSFKYPGNWHFGGTEITKKQLKDKGIVFFWIDSKSEDEIKNGQNINRSPGHVEVWIEDGSSILKAHMRQKDFNKLGKGSFGNETGIIDEGVDRTTEGLYAFRKQLYVKTDNHDYYIDSLTYSDGTSVFSQIKARYYHIIGSLIIGSFRFN